MTGADRPAERYDVIVIGLGLGGVSAAACLARAGRKVLAVDRGEGPGGYARAFKRDGGYLFDPAVHVTPTGFGGLDFWEVYLTVLGIRDQVDLIKLDPTYGVVFPDLSFHAPSGVEPYIAEHQRLFPSDAEGIEGFVRACCQITSETHQMSSRLSLDDLEAAMKAFPLMFKYRLSTLGEALDEFIEDPRARAALGAAWPYLGVPPSMLSFVQYAAMLAAMIEKGPGYVRGSFGSLADALGRTVTDNGGQVLLDTLVTGISVSDGRATGVTLADGTKVEADAVVAGIDARQALEQLVGVEHLPDRYARRLGRMRPSLSAFVVYAATTLDVPASGLGHETFVYGDWDHDKTYERVLGGEIGGTWISLPTVNDPSLAPEGEHLVICSSLMPFDIGAPWESARDRYTESMMDGIEKLLPGFRAATTYQESATPETFERYTLNSRGAIYGWENVPGQSLPKRLAHQTPVDGLFLAGHWTEPGAGSFRATFSGLQAAQSILGYDTPVELLGALHEAGA